ncbi:MAG TPA: hypothetical protein VHA75_13215, partial [Rugosimonospora sp.]|nr:hypothetical protein [Rugosimonospora sp.]
MTVTLTVTLQDVWPPRVALAVAGMTLGDDLVLYRAAGGVRTAVRGGTVAGVTDTGLSTIDAELPFGTPVTYVAVINGADVATVGPTTYSLPGGKVALSDAITGLAAEVMILAPLQAKTWDPQATVFKAGGRNVVVGAALGQYTTSYDLFVAATSSAETLETLLRNATEGTVLIRQPGGYPGIDDYLAILGVDQAPVTDDGL